jgi:hypothetical protein
MKEEISHMYKTNKQLRGIEEDSCENPEQNISRHIPMKAKQLIPAF